jgi:hypothetical protein
MVVSVKFKDKNKIFRGHSYDYRLNKEEKIPKVGAIIRMMDNDYNWKCYGTRVRIENIRKETVEDINLDEIRYLETTLDD